jgi:hypothetical protein
MQYEDREGVRSGEAGPPIKLIAFLIIAALTVIFVFQNREKHAIDFLFFEVNTRTWFALAVAVVLGVILDRLFISWWRRRGRRRAA